MSFKRGFRMQWVKLKRLRLPAGLRYCGQSLLMCALDPHRKQQRTSIESRFLQGSFWCLPSSAMCSGLLSESRLRLYLDHKSFTSVTQTHSSTQSRQLTRQRSRACTGILYLLLTHGAVLHEVANLATDAAAAVIGRDLSLCEDFRIKEILLGHEDKSQL